MKTIIFFDRSDLTLLYILLSKELQGKVNIIHVAFSNKEKMLLKEAGILDFVDYHEEISKLVDKIKPSDLLIKEIDDTIITQSKGLLNLNGSIQSDRGYSVLNYEEALLLACCHYTAWKNIFQKQHVDLLFHEPASQFMTHIAALNCKKQGGKYIYLTQLQGDRKGFFYLNIDGEDFSCKELEDKYIYFKNNPLEINIERCKDWVASFNNNYNIAFADLVNSKAPRWKLCYSAIRHILMRGNRFDRLKDNIDYWLQQRNYPKEKLYNLRQYKKRGIVFSQPIEGELYFYYSIHLEPEATVLYLSGGLYTNQVKLIENIAAALPPGYYLYVKDHPHEYAYRRADDYERLMKIPNIRLIDQRISGKRLVKGAIGVFTINGTAGFEGLMLGKNVYCFGKSYYSICKQVHYIHNIREAREIIYNSIGVNYYDEIDFYAYIYAYLTSLHEGFVAYFDNRENKAGIDIKKNARVISASIMNLIESI